jgi:GMP synthase (glutamine-hydrolysing)
MSLHFLVIEGNPRDVRERVARSMGRTSAESYGDLVVALAGHGATFNAVCAADADAVLPDGQSLEDFDGVLITGSVLHVWQREPEALRQVELARAVFRSQVPFFGSCWGLQVATVAAGGEVHRNPRGREIGYARGICPTESGSSHPMLAGRPSVFDAPCSHLDEVKELAPDSTLLASNAMSEVQAAEIRHEGGQFWGVQYHPEYRHAHIAYLLEFHASKLTQEGFFSSDEDRVAMVADLRLLDEDPTLAHVAKRYELSPEVTDPARRPREIMNFIRWCERVKSERGRA